MNEEAYRDRSGTDLWIGSDLTSGTLDEKRECMGYDSIPPLGLIPRRLRIVDPVRKNRWRRMMVVVLSLDFHRLLRSCSRVTDPKGFGLSSYAVPLPRV